MMSSSLTLLLTLKGRPLHTLRWLWHANRTKLAFPVIVADGEVHPRIAALLENPQTFPNLDLRYFRYHDASFSDFYRKCSDAIGKVMTPFAMMQDNDDFVFPSGLEADMAFLQENPDYVCAGGRVAGFSLHPQPAPKTNLTGPLHLLKHRYSDNYACQSHDSASIAHRAVNETRNYSTIYYNIYRTETLQTVANEIIRHNFTDLEIHEMFWALRTVTLGKTKGLPQHYSYFRQYGTSLGNAFQVDWVHHLLRSNFTEDFHKMVTAIAEAAARADNTSPEAIAEDLRNAYGDGLRISLSRRYGGAGSQAPLVTRVKQIVRDIAPNILTMTYKSYRNDLARARVALFDSIKGDGATAAFIERQRTELDLIEQTLSGGEFLAFIEQCAPELMTYQ